VPWCYKLRRFQWNLQDSIIFYYPTKLAVDKWAISPI
jgi:hypothetical protein